MENKKIGIVFGIIAALIWGSWPVMSKVASIQSLSPLDITALRFTVSGIILLPFLVYKSIGMRVIFLKGTVLAIGAGAPYVMLATYGINLSSSAHFGAIAPSTMLVFSSIGSIFLFKEQLTFARVLGIVFILLGVLGIGLLSFERINIQIILGDIMFIGCGALWASFTLLCKFWKLNAWTATSMVSVISGVLCIPFTVTVIQGLPTELILYHGVYQGVFVAIIALYSYSKSVSILGAAKGALFSSLVPPISLILGVIILGESMHNNEIMGAVLICIGMLLALGIYNLKPQFCTKRLTLNKLK